MNGASRERWFARVPWGLIGMFCLVWAVERTVAHQALDCGNPLGLEWERGGWAAGRDAPGRKVLIFGDSLAKMGLVPRVIEARSGLGAYNLAIGAGQATSSYFQLRHALRAGAKPAAVLVNFFPHRMWVGPRHVLHQWAYLLDLREAAELSWSARDGGLFATIALGLALPSLRGRDTIRLALVATLSGRPSVGRVAMPSLWRNWNVNDGAQVMPARPETPFYMPGYEESYRRFDCNELNRTYIGKFLELASAHGIPVVWLLTPIMPELQAKCQTSGFDDDHARFVRDWQSRHPGLLVLDARRAGYDPKVFFDPNHLGRDGAYVYSADVGDFLNRFRRESLGSVRWFDLPGYTPRTADPPVEDLAQSDVALRSRSGRLRR